jgi:D-alanyl-D-alanine carboxypeptidase
MTAAACPDRFRHPRCLIPFLYRSLLGFAALIAVACQGQAFAATGFSAMVVDAHNGNVLFSQNADAPRYPASLTKVMTLYVLFEELKADRLKLTSRLKCSAYGASRPPSKLGLRPGDTLTVEEAVKALVTRSANDVAATIAENISGSEKAFAARMTNTAKLLGMSRTTFRNASGLPDPAQVTTARDMATLSLRIQRDFPHYYTYFRITSFTYKGRAIRTHNRLLGKYPGTDGIKTGYIHASGYNLTTSVARKGKRLVGVVMGGRTGAARNAYMMKMLDKHFGKASTSRTNVIAALAGIPPGGGKQTTVASAPVTPSAASAVPLPKTKAEVLAAKTAAPGTTPASQGGTDAKATSVTQKVEDTLPAAGGELATLLPEARPGPQASSEMNVTDTEEDEAEEGDLDWPVPSSAGKNHRTPEKEELATDSLFKIAAAAAAESREAGKPATEQKAALAPSWQIQIGAFPTKDGAMRMIDKALALDLNPLTGKTAIAVPITRGSSTLYRARFSGFDKTSARAACKELARKGVSCLPLAPQG